MLVTNPWESLRERKSNSIWNRPLYNCSCHGVINFFIVLYGRINIHRLWSMFMSRSNFFDTLLRGVCSNFVVREKNISLEPRKWVFKALERENVLSGGQYRIRTCDLYNVNVTL